ncbi:hypothetical protein LX36DRAFT_656561, partial [Colletotrichum falcatum]
RIILAIALSFLRDAYTQSTTNLNRVILACLPVEIRHLYPVNTIMKMDTLTFNPCLLISGKNNANFALIGMQTDDTIGLTDKTFSDCEETALKEATFTAKPNTNGEITLRQKDIKDLNRRIIWQIKNLKRGLRFLPLNLETVKLFVFVDGSFANNADLTSQLSFITPDDTGMFTVTGNIIHFSSTKCKRVTWSVLASEIYAMVAGADIAHAIGTTLALITERLAIPLIPTVICTDSYSLYECLSYERREIHEIRWIHGSDNPADSFTKSSPNSALEALVSDGKVKIWMNGWVS